MWSGGGRLQKVSVNTSAADASTSAADASTSAQKDANTDQSAVEGREVSSHTYLEDMWPEPRL